VTRARGGESALTGRSDALIHFLCVLSDHLRDPQLESDHITVVEGRWAFCAANVREEKHEWQATGGITRADVARQLAQRRVQKT
jgi:hypothetical protein